MFCTYSYAAVQSCRLGYPAGAVPCGRPYRRLAGSLRNWTHLSCQTFSPYTECMIDLYVRAVGLNKPLAQLSYTCSICRHIFGIALPVHSHSYAPVKFRASLGRLSDDVLVWLAAANIIQCWASCEHAYVSARPFYSVGLGCRDGSRRFRSLVLRCVCLTFWDVVNGWRWEVVSDTSRRRCRAYDFVVS